jgi:hypothetical protein
MDGGDDDGPVVVEYGDGAAYSEREFYIDGARTFLVRGVPRHASPDLGWATRTTDKRVRDGRTYHSRRCAGVYERRSSDSSGWWMQTLWTRRLRCARGPTTGTWWSGPQRSARAVRRGSTTSRARDSRRACSLPTSWSATGARGAPRWTAPAGAPAILRPRCSSAAGGAAWTTTWPTSRCGRVCLWWWSENVHAFLSEPSSPSRPPRARVGARWRSSTACRARATTRWSSCTAPLPVADAPIHDVPGYAQQSAAFCAAPRRRRDARCGVDGRRVPKDHPRCGGAGRAPTARHGRRAAAPEGACTGAASRSRVDSTATACGRRRRFPTLDQVFPPSL